MDAKEVLKTYFGYDSYKTGQEEIIQTILAGRDVLAVMPTGAGKSICYQVPAMILLGITIVISPLISLMQDQVKALNEAGIHAAFINSSLSEAQITEVYSRSLMGEVKILYAAPERLENSAFTEFAEQMDISMVTVDEAHCISQWGQDFRPGYLKIVDFIGQLRRRPVVSAFTATATEEVKADISRALQLREPEIVATGFDRENLYFEVETVKKKDEYIRAYIGKHPEDSGIVYCATRKNVDNLYGTLSAAGISVTRYHAGMTNEERKESQDDFIYDRVQVIIATNAFGMGIDKSNVRFVIHYNMPQSMENYYQEAGRAGRDGEPAKCILLFSAQDIVINRFLLDHKEFAEANEEDIALIRQQDVRRLQVMEGYCRTSGCLRNYILAYFGEKREKPCDSCGNCQREYTETDMTEAAKQVVNCVWESKGRYGLNIILGTLLGTGRARLKELGTTEYKTYGVLKDRKRSELRLLTSQMIEEGYLCQTADRFSVIRLGNIEPLRDPDTRIVIRTYEGADPERQARRTDSESIDGNGTDGRSRQGNAIDSRNIDGRSTAGMSTGAAAKTGNELFDRLRKLRLTIAREAGVPPYIVFSDKTLTEMSVKMPREKASMLQITGVGKVKCEKYGGRFLDAIREYLGEKPENDIGAPEPEVIPRGSSRRAEYNRRMSRPDGAGAAWTEEEDAQLDEEYRSGMKISEIAKKHDRTRGGIRARLKKHGIIV